LGDGFRFERERPAGDVQPLAPCRFARLHEVSGKTGVGRRKVDRG
jgi:hypothetical protein